LRGRILWVDDEIELLKPHILYMEEKGYSVETVTNGRDAVSSISGSRFDLVLLDQMMPGMDGIATLHEIKEVNLAIPIIMITKNEEEWLMDEAISAKTAGYLTKPVNPSQIFLACKKIMEEEQILEQRTASGYLKDFQEIEAALATELDADDWWKLYLRIVQWQIEMGERKDLGLSDTLDDQLKSANRKFTQFISENYERWLQSEPGMRPITSVDVITDFVLPHLKTKKKVFFLLVDCFRLDQALTILSDIQRYFDVEYDYHLSLLPSATPFCRNAIFSGEFLSDLKDKTPRLWQDMIKDETSMNRFEPDLLKRLLKNLTGEDVPFVYRKVSVAKEGRSFLGHLKEYMDTPLITLVVNAVDLLTHHRAKSDILQEMIADESGYRSTVKTWFANSWLLDVLRTLSDSDYTVILTSDHGSVRVKKGVRVRADRETSSGVRYKYGKNLNCSDKNAMVVKRPPQFKLPEMITGTNYLIAKDDVYFVYPTQYRKYLHQFEESFQHGGISMEEMLVPTFTLKSRLA
jgi:CheY-like chemotaxis protein|tara:strand:- start:1062 stop:2621 length:1560 start_codon:yes stop_codon:yes gene_type:complete